MQWMVRASPIADAHDGRDPAGRMAISPIRRQNVGMTRGAQPGDKDAVWPDAGPLELIASRAPAVEVPLVGSDDGRKPLHRRIAWENERTTLEPSVRQCPVIAKSPPYVVADFVAAGADTGPDRRDQPVGTGSEFEFERSNGTRRGASRESAPAGMDGRHDVQTRIGDQYRRAVGRLNRQRGGLVVCHEDVGVRQPLWRGASAIAVNVDPVDLVNSNQPLKRHARGGSDLRPRFVAPAAAFGSKRPSPRRKEVVGERGERVADKRQVSVSLDPAEVVVRC